MRRPVGVVVLHRLAGALIDDARLQLLHGDAALHRADIDAEVAGHAFLVDHLEDAVRATW
jgi:hypothetical protein